MSTRFATILTTCFLLVFSMSGCAPTNSEARAYLNEVLAYLDHGVHANAQEWRDTRIELIDDLGDMESPAQMYPALKKATIVAGGRHSIFRTPQEVFRWDDRSRTLAEAGLPKVSVVDGVGVVKLFGLQTDNPSLRESYARTAVTEMERVAGEVSCGWVVDLKENTGGAMYPMLGAVSPLLNDGTVMEIVVEEDKSWIAVDIHGTEVQMDGIVKSLSVGNAPKVNLPVGVQIGRHTASAGEAVAIAFIDQSNSGIFGQPSMGFTSTNSVFPLPDGSRLTLSTGWMTDRNRNVFHEGIRTKDLTSDQSAIS